MLCFKCREYKRDGLNIICRIANHHADILYIPAELHAINDAVILEVDYLCNFLSCSFRHSILLVSVVCAVISDTLIYHVHYKHRTERTELKLTFLIIITRIFNMSVQSFM